MASTRKSPSTKASSGTKVSSGKTVRYIYSPNFSKFCSHIDYSVHALLVSDDCVLTEEHKIYQLKEYTDISMEKKKEYTVVYPTILSFSEQVQVKVCDPSAPYIHSMNAGEELYIYYPCILTFHTSNIDIPSSVYVKTNTFVFPDGILLSYRLSILAVIRSIGDKVSGTLTLEKTSLLVGNSTDFSFLTKDRRVHLAEGEGARPIYNFIKLPAGDYTLNGVYMTSRSAAESYARLHRKISESREHYTHMLPPSEIFFDNSYPLNDLPMLGPGSDILDLFSNEERTPSLLR